MSTLARRHILQKLLLNLGSEETYGCEVVGGYVYRGSKHLSLWFLHFWRLLLKSNLGTK